MNNDTITNGDKIRQMSNEEIYDFFMEYYVEFALYSRKQIIAWLNAPAESEERNVQQGTKPSRSCK